MKKPDFTNISFDPEVPRISKEEWKKKFERNGKIYRRFYMADDGTDSCAARFTTAMILKI